MQYNCFRVGWLDLFYIFFLFHTFCSKIAQILQIILNQYKVTSSQGTIGFFLLFIYLFLFVCHVVSAGNGNSILYLLI